MTGWMVMRRKKTHVDYTDRHRVGDGKTG